MPDLIPPHGGLTEPVSCIVPPDEHPTVLERAARLTKVPISDADLSTVYRFGDGALSPLRGPMDGATYRRVLDESVIEHGGRLYAWTIPIGFPVTADLARQLAAGKTVVLVNSAGAIVATLLVADVYPWGKLPHLRRGPPPGATPQPL